MTDPHAAPRRRRARPPRVPPPSLHPGERVRGSAILEENPECGLLLWESYRNVGDWATTPRDRRVAGMFGPGAAERRAEQLAAAAVPDGPVRAALEVIRGVVADPAHARPRMVALACRRLAAWAGEQGRPVTQFYFAAGAALCAPGEARHAYQAGRLARDLARWDAAEAWLEFAVASAKRGRDRETQVSAVLGLGNSFYRQGFYQKARETHLAGLEIARRHNLREYCGRALHDLFVVSLDLCDTYAAEGYAREALAAYGATHPNVPALAYDVAYFWLSQGYASRALPVLRAVLPHLRHPGQRVRVLASAARAAAEMGDRIAYAELVRQVRVVGREPLAKGAFAAALFETALGASRLHHQELARRLLDEVLDVAHDRGEADVLARAEDLRGRIAAGPPTEPNTPAAGQDSSSFAHELVNCLQATETTDSGRREASLVGS